MLQNIDTGAFRIFTVLLVDILVLQTFGRDWWSCSLKPVQAMSHYRGRRSEREGFMGGFGIFHVGLNSVDVSIWVSVTNFT